MLSKKDLCELAIRSEDSGRCGSDLLEVDFVELLHFGWLLSFERDFSFTELNERQSNGEGDVRNEGMESNGIE